MLKTLLGLVNSRNIKATGLREGSLDVLYGRTQWPNGAGFYFDTEPAVYESDSLLVETSVPSETLEEWT